ncbi:MAG: hypothetical protein MUE73_08120 [Planctomycetes bacterium]|jgi:hypothetical protein|nr:hypothetical protein [Planctomycetota bacterium]
MPRKPRRDEPGALFHVWNRGVAQRAVFEGRREVRYFLARLALAVRMGLIEVIAYSFPLNHFHLVIRSRTGDLARAMRLVESMFVRKFNPPRDRDGPLFRARYGSMRIQSRRYLFTLICYIDQNCIRGGLALDPADFEFGSAYHYARERRPPWLGKEFVRDLLRARLQRGQSFREAYRAVFGRPLTPAEVELVRRRMIFPSDHPDPLDDLIGAALPRTREWLIRQAELADGTASGVVLLPPDALLEVLSEERVAPGPVRLARNRVDAGPILLAGLLRGLCGATLAEAAALTGSSRSRVSENAARHRDLMVRDEGYAVQAAHLVERAMARAYPGRED